uniref:Uncharacterized protein n=1 Tax=Geobacter sp. (strain M21) TaxID=443144 RepID=C6E6R2_GEOSM
MWGIGYEGIGVRTLTLLLAAAIVAADVGKVIKASANDTVDLCAAGDKFGGVLKQVEADSRIPAGTVQDKGMCTIAYTGAPGLGWQQLVADGNGGVTLPAAAVAASLVTGVVANNNALKWTSKYAGELFNDISITLIDPPGNNVALSVDVVGRDILVTLATDAASAIITTAAELKAAIEASSAADLVTVANEGVSTGAAVVAAVVKTDLAGGADAGEGREYYVWNKDAVAGTLVIDLG